MWPFHHLTPIQTPERKWSCFLCIQRPKAPSPRLCVKGTPVPHAPRCNCVSSRGRAVQSLTHAEGLGRFPSCPPRLLCQTIGTGTTGVGAQTGFPATHTHTYFFCPHLQTPEGLRRSHKSLLQEAVGAPQGCNPPPPQGTLRVEAGAGPGWPLPEPLHQGCGYQP